MTTSIDERRAALERALRHIGQPVTEPEVQAFIEQETSTRGDTDVPVTRRRFLSGVGMAAATAGVATLSARPAAAKAPPGAVEYPVQADPTREQGRMMGTDGGYGSRSQFETEVRSEEHTSELQSHL